jgi:glutamine amidotransferase
MSLVIVDTGCANLSSVAFAFERLGAQPVISSDAATIQDAKQVILPGVGSAPFAMAQINKRGLVPIVQNLSQPVLGICLGMQLLFQSLEEGKEHTQGFGVIEGYVKQLDTKENPSPHMGWNTLNIVKDDPITKGMKAQDFAYFVHSYAAPLGDYTLVSADYGSSFSAIVRKNNFWGCQFHPERSSATGAMILKNFLDITL